MPKKKAVSRPALYPWIVPELQQLATPIDQLELDPKNPRIHDEENIRVVLKSLKREGQYHPLLVNSRNNQVVIGNCRLVAARRLGWTHLATIQKPMSEAQQARLSMVDNRTAELADWDALLLEASLGMIEEESLDLADLLRYELALDELNQGRRGKNDSPEGEPELEGLEYRIIILCRDEEHQATLLSRFEQENLECQALIS